MSLVTGQQDQETLSPLCSITAGFKDPGWYPRHMFFFFIIDYWNFDDACTVLLRTYGTCYNCQRHGCSCVICCLVISSRYRLCFVTTSKADCSPKIPCTFRPLALFPSRSNLKSSPAHETPSASTPLSKRVKSKRVWEAHGHRSASRLFFLRVLLVEPTTLPRDFVWRIALAQD